MSSNILENKLHEAIALSILGKDTPSLFRSDTPQGIALREAINASRELYVTLQDPSSSLRSITHMLGKKHVVAKRYTKITGLAWHF